METFTKILHLDSKLLLSSSENNCAFLHSKCALQHVNTYHTEKKNEIKMV